MYLTKARSFRPSDNDISAAFDQLDQLIAESRDEEAEMLEKTTKAVVPYEGPVDEASEQQPGGSHKSEEVPVNIIEFLETMEDQEQMWEVGSL